MKHSDKNRRDFIKYAGSGAAAFLLHGCDSGGDTQKVKPFNKFIETRKKAAHRKRRIIMNNDGNDLNAKKPDEPVTPEIFLGKRTTPLLGSHVDSIFYCTGVFNFYSHKSDETELLTSDESAAKYVHELIQQGTDSLEIMTKFCHDNNLEVFWSMRMNDNHDATRPFLLCEWKKNNPQYLMGKQGDEFPYVRGNWSIVDYAIPEVRDKVFRILNDVAVRYDVDGLELDFFRHPAFFKPQVFGEPVTQQHCDLMTGLIRRIRTMAEETARKRNRPMLISVRIPDSVGYCKAIGLDTIRWLDDDLIDIIAAPGYFKLEPWENLVELGGRYNVPVYACFVSRRVMGGGEPEADTAIGKWRGEALNAWNAGVDGIYTFNRFDPHDQLFRELGDPELLRTLDRIDQTNYAGESGYLDPEYWLKDGRDFILSGI
ncbi:MAG: family 10 glycosylhydrolase [Candidatus Latescibacteria bacterium]|nr:family 10 glycosylhydrolase [Candidatus Latescibacterota bacterium]